MNNGKRITIGVLVLAVIAIMVKFLFFNYVPFFNADKVLDFDYYKIISISTKLMFIDDTDSCFYLNSGENLVDRKRAALAFEFDKYYCDKLDSKKYFNPYPNSGSFGSIDSITDLKVFLIKKNKQIEITDKLDNFVLSRQKDLTINTNITKTSFLARYGYRCSELDKSFIDLADFKTKFNNKHKYVLRNRLDEGILFELMVDSIEEKFLSSEKLVSYMKFNNRIITDTLSLKNIHTGEGYE